MDKISKKNIMTMKENVSQAVKCYYPFGEILKPVVQQDRTKKKHYCPLKNEKSFRKVERTA